MDGELKKRMLLIVIVSWESRQYFLSIPGSVPIECDVTQNKIYICNGDGGQHDGEANPESNRAFECHIFTTTILTHLKKSTKLILYP